MTEQLEEETPDIDWRNRAVCRDMDPEIFFPSTTDVYGITQAAQICQLSCPVLADCALETLAMRRRPDEGVWAGVPMMSGILPRQTMTRLLKRRAAGSRMPLQLVKEKS